MIRPSILRLFTLFLAFAACGSPPLLAAIPIGAPDGRKLETSPDAVQVAREGKALVPITIAPDASPEIRAAASELAGTLREMTGAEFTVKEGGEAAGITVGTLGQFPDPALSEALKLNGAWDGLEAYAIRSGNGTIRLLGGTGKGAAQAATRFLQLLGARHYFQGPQWRIVPRREAIAFDLNEVSRPRVLWRAIRYTTGSPNRPEEKGREQASGNRDLAAWSRDNMMGEPFTLYAQHSYPAVYQKFKDEFQEHPEYNALVNGSRAKPGQFCQSNPRVREMFLQTARDYFTAYPDRDMISMEPKDGGGWCECEECAKLGTNSDRAFGLANEVARMLQKEFPGKSVGILAYYTHADVPSAPMEPNVHVQVGNYVSTGTYRFEVQLENWARKTKNLGVYDYLSQHIWGHDRLRPPANTGLGGRLRELTEHIREITGPARVSYVSESSITWGQYGLGYYLLANLLWDPQCDVDALKEDFYRGAFGPAAAPMKRFYERLDADSGRLLTDDFYAASFDDLAEATRLAAGDSGVLERIGNLKQFFHNSLLEERFTQFKGTDQEKEYWLEVFTTLYRSRFTYMNHSTGMIVVTGESLAQRFGDNSWKYRAKNAPWRNENPFTPEEIESNFAADRARLKPAGFKEVSFPGPLREAAFPVKENQAADTLRTSGIYQLVANVHEGGPAELPVSFTDGAVAREVGHYVVKNGEGKVVAGESFNTEGKGAEHIVKTAIRFPGPGQYRVWLKGSGALPTGVGIPWAIELDPLSNVGGYATGGAGGLYFYVPRGTKEIQMYLYKPMKVVDPDGQVVRDGEQGLLSIPVADGADGRPWSLRGRMAQVRFYNVPNYLFLDPSAALVPEVVYTADNLSNEKSQ